MKRTLLSAVCCLALTPAAFAGGANDEHHQPAPTPSSGSTYNATATNTALAGAAARANAASTSQSRSAAQATGGHANATGGTANAAGGSASGGRASAAGGAGGNGGNASAQGAPVTVNNSTGGGGSRQNNNTPDVLAPAINGGNPCAVGGTAGLSMPGFGIVGGYSGEGQDCTRRASAALLYNMGFRGPAKDILCQDTRYSTAFAQAGQPCSADVQRWQREGYRQDDNGYWVK